MRAGVTTIPLGRNHRGIQSNRRGHGLLEYQLQNPLKQCQTQTTSEPQLLRVFYYNLLQHFAYSLGLYLRLHGHYSHTLGSNINPVSYGSYYKIYSFFPYTYPSFHWFLCSCGQVGYYTFLHFIALLYFVALYYTQFLYLYLIS